MDELFVVFCIRSSKGFWDDMVYFKQITIFEVQFTPGTFPLLSFEKTPYGFRGLWVFSSSCSPINPVAIIWTPAVLDLRVPFYGHFGMFPESVFVVFRRKYPSFGFYKPIFVADPMQVLVWVATVRPCSELLVHYGVYCGECFFAHLGRVVSGPSHDDRIELGYQRLLR